MPAPSSQHFSRYALLVAVLGVALPAWRSQAVAQLSLREKIGQMVMVTVTGDSLEHSSPSVDTAKADLADGLLGGVIMFNWSRNLEDPAQILHLTQQLQARARIPLFLAIDQEGGQVARLRASNGFAATPSAYHVGTEVNLESYTRASAAQMAGWFVGTGLNMNLAPVVDVNVNPLSPAIGARERSFSEDPDSVVAHAGWFIEEFRSRGIITTLKHFPGHGSAAGDSHLGFTDVTSTWSAVELIPYEELLAANRIDAVMTAHVYNANIDTLHPATLSEQTITGLLRNSIGYQGVIVSDAMGMAAISQFYGIDQAAELAVKAGVDILLYTANLDSTGNSLARRIVEFLARRVADGSIPEQRIDESFTRIMTLKNQYLTGIQIPGVAAVPSDFLLENYPNPFNPTTTIRFSVPNTMRVRLTVFDMLGRQVVELVDGEYDAGTYRVAWDASSQPSGIYVCYYEAGEYTAAKKMILVR